MKTLVAKLGFDKRLFPFGRKGVVVVLVVFAVLFTLNVILAFILDPNEPLDFSTLTNLFGVAAFILFAVAELLHETALNLAVSFRLAGASAAIAAVVFSVADVYLLSGPWFTMVFVGVISMVIVVGIYFQRRFKE